MATGKKTGGRSAGTPNKVSAELRDWITSLIDENRDQLAKDFKELNPRDRLFLAEKLMKYCVPQLAAVSSSIEFENLTDEDLDLIIEKLKNSG